MSDNIPNEVVMEILGRLPVKTLLRFSLYLWNPSIRKFVVLPRPRITCSSHGFDYYRVLGFGFDSTTNDYKVVRIVYISGGTEVDIYSLKEGDWRRISVSGPVPRIDCDPSHAYVNGTIHWVTRGRNCHNFIVLFNLGTKVFSQMELPTSLQRSIAQIGQPRSLSLAVFQDSLCVFQSDSYNRKASIWMMKEYCVVESWTNLFNLDYSREFPLREEFGVVDPWANLFTYFSSRSALSVRVIGLKRNGEVLLVKDEKMISVDIKAQTFRYLGISGREAAFSVNTYTESLVLIDKASGLQEG
ncbi:F-box/kelch-repeat protein At3g06240-like [Cornus florida]|uniref:F-box/kelch-repeat protein At3g06240-like n=1 Tax=Cornus florida TaxID=4283 RepID=UPI00289CC8C9|nr:F-box/kelch-repeat protein At3g06240-like [Cornus florida]